jgi:dienelactone hydrolase
VPIAIFAAAALALAAWSSRADAEWLQVQFDFSGGLSPGLEAESTALDALLTRENRSHEMHIYLGANHAFNFPSLPFLYNAGAASDAWNRSLKFLDHYLKPVTAN